MVRESLEQLVEQATAGDVKSFERLVERYQGVVFGAAYHWTQSSADAQDVAQEVLYLAFENLSQLREPARFASWLNRITANQCSKMARNRERSMPSIDAPGNTLQETLPDPAPLADRKLESSERDAAVQAILARLSEKERLAVTLFYLDDLSYREVSEFLDVPISTVKGRLHKARKHLKKEALSMVEDVLGSQHNRPHIEIEKVFGFICLEEDGSGRLRPTTESPSSPDDVAVSATNVALHGLDERDFVRCHARLPESGRHLRGAIRFEEINGREAVQVLEPTHGAPQLSTEVQQVKIHAGEAARRLNHGYIGTEHILLGILNDRSGSAARILADLGVELDVLQRQVEQWFANDATAYVEDETKFTPRAERTFQSATGEAETLGSNSTRVEHLFLALARDRNGAAAQALCKVGVDAEAIAAHIPG